MKKIAVPVVLLMLILTVAIGYGIGRATQRMTLERQCSDHLIAAARGEGESIGIDGDGVRTRLTYSNVRAFLNAVTRTETQLSLFRFGLEELPGIRVEFCDGGIIEVFDAGIKDGRDLVYIRHTFRGRTTTFSLSGYRTFERVCQCISPGGYNEPNTVLP